MSNTGLEEKVEKMNVEEKEAKGQKGSKKTKGETRKKEDLSAFPLELKPQPAFIKERIVLFDKLKAQYDAQIEAKEKTPIKITLHDGKVVDGLAWKTTPYEIAASISQGLADNTVVCKVNGEVFDLDRVLEGDCSLEFLNFDDDEAKAVFWHSTAHIMGEAMERHYGGHLCYGPPTEEGYYYDMFCEGRQVSSNDYPSLDSLTKSIVKEKQPFVRLVMTKEELLEMFKYNEFKCRIIQEKINTPSTTVYRCGPLIDVLRTSCAAHWQNKGYASHKDERMEEMSRRSCQKRSQKTRKRGVLQGLIPGSCVAQHLQHQAMGDLWTLVALLRKHVLI
ncbi:threonine--tRNA ligase, cytoplasmic-like [Porites lutea]|uniref:threonine--tRNA ligase, cytoplasmic-like n=1 Tax=Porites lutea TaxID=51062 RepID=UPI003CC5AC47